jgi:hypothetical protein
MRASEGEPFLRKRLGATTATSTRSPLKNTTYFLQIDVSHARIGRVHLPEPKLEQHQIMFSIRAPQGEPFLWKPRGPTTEVETVLA